MKVSKKIIITISIIIIILLNLLFLLLLNKKDNKIVKNVTQKTEEQIKEENKNKLLSDLERSNAIEVREFGFTITYESGKNRFIILITENPFEYYKNKAFDYIKQKGVDRCKINYLVIQDKGIKLPLDSKELAGCK